jgi:hypothetical protein
MKQLPSIKEAKPPKSKDFIPRYDSADDERKPAKPTEMLDLLLLADSIMAKVQDVLN